MALEFTKETIRKYTGNESQLFGIKSYTFDEGREKGTKAFEVDTGAGLRFTVLADRCMDISYAQMGHRNVSFIAKPGIVSPQYYDTYGDEWLRSFGGGLLTTCGLSQIGIDESGQERGLGLHGRIGNTPAYDLSHDAGWSGGEYVMTVSGKMRESVLYGENIVLKRTIKAVGGQNKFTVRDEIENMGIDDFKLLLLYHCNFGYPLLREGTKLVADVKRIWTNDKKSKSKIDEAMVFPGPQERGDTLVYFYEMAEDEEGKATVWLINEQEGFGVYIKYDKIDLPFFTQWKNTGPQDYVTGLEPGTGFPIGRSENLKANTYKRIVPGEKVSIALEFGLVNL